ncbi:MAG: hypothetical protein KDI55_24815 [Anaerolineae bacterium]|nr:hypothetical protein [Anaerolineae bacterium]
MHDIDGTSDVANESPGIDVSLSPTGQRAMQGDAGPSPAVPETPPDDQPTDFHSRSADTELGYGRMVETGAEKSEVTRYHDNAPEGIYGEGRGGRG